MTFIAPQWLTEGPHRPPNDTQGDRTPEAIYAAVGRLTNRWEGVELALLTLYTFIVKGNTGTMRAFGAVIGSGARCDMIEAATKGMLLPDKEPDFADEIKRTLVSVRRLGALRNMVAHGIVAAIKDEGLIYYQKPPENRDYFVTPAFYNTPKTTDRLGPKIWFASSTIETISTTIMDLSDHIVEMVTPSDPAQPPQDEGWTVWARRTT